MMQETHDRWWSWWSEAEMVATGNLITQWAGLRAEFRRAVVGDTPVLRVEGRWDVFPLNRENAYEVVDIQTGMTRPVLVEGGFNQKTMKILGGILLVAKIPHIEGE